MDIQGPSSQFVDPETVHRIGELERQLRERNSELDRSRTRLERLVGGRRRGPRHAGQRYRRMGRAGDMFRQTSMIDEDDEDEGDDLALSPDGDLGSNFILEVTRIVPECLTEIPLSASSDFESPVPSEERPIPLSVRRLEGRRFRVGSQGGMIGCGRGCYIRLPHETGLKENHLKISWISENDVAEFCLWDKGFFEISSSEPISVLHPECSSSGPHRIQNGMRFCTAGLEWTVRPFPLRKYVSAKMFHLIKSSNLESLKSLIEDVRKIHWTKLFPLDFNAEEDDITSDTEEGDAQPMPINRYLAYSYRGYERRTRLSEGGRRKRSLLFAAIESGHIDLIEYLIEKGALINKKVGAEEQTALHLAIKLDSEKLVKELLRCSADVEIEDSCNRTPLGYARSHTVRRLLLSSMLLCSACDAGDLPEVKRLLETEVVSPNALGLQHKAALHFASAGGHTQVVDYLIHKGADSSVKGGSRSRTALHYASVHNHVDVAKRLLEAGIDENEQDTEGYTALNLSMGGDMCRLLHKKPLSLCLAAQSGDVEDARRILEERTSGSDQMENMIDQRNERNHAALHLASAAGHRELVKLLVSHGATVDLPGGADEWTPLFFSALAGHAGVVEVLLDFGADPEILDKNSVGVRDHVSTALEESNKKINALRARKNSEVTEEGGLLFLNIPGSLDRQVSNQSFESQLAWLQRRKTRLASIFNMFHTGAQRLIQAIEKRSFEDARELLDSGLDVNAPLAKDSPANALYRCCEWGLPDFVELLLKYSADVNLVGPEGHYPIHTAAQHGNAEVIEKLLDAQADSNQMTVQDHLTALHMAAAGGHRDAVITLLKRGADRLLASANGNTAFDYGFNVGVKKILSCTPTQHLYVAVAEGNEEELVRLMDEEGVPAGTTFSDGQTALHVACQTGKLTAVQELVKRGANVNQQSGLHNSAPLHIACRLSDTSVLSYLLENGAQVSLKNSQGRTPFEMARNNASRKLLVQARTVYIRRPSEDASAVDQTDNSKKCRICMDNVVNTIILPCGHQAFCTECAAKITECALDRQPIHEIVTVYCS